MNIQFSIWMETLNIQAALHHCYASFKYIGYETGPIVTIIPNLEMSILVR